VTRQAAIACDNFSPHKLRLHSRSGCATILTFYNSRKMSTASHNHSTLL